MKKLSKILKSTGKVLLFIVTSIVLIAFIYSRIGNTTVKADIKGVGTQVCIVVYYSADGTKSSFKPAFFINDKASIRIRNEKTTIVRIQFLDFNKAFRSTTIKSYVDANTTTVLEGERIDNAIDYNVVEGSRYAKEYAVLRKSLLPYYIEETKFYAEAKRVKDDNPELSRILMHKFDSVRFEVSAYKRTEFAKQHLDFLIVPTDFLESHVPRDTTIKYYHLLSDEVKASTDGKMLGGIIKGWENTAIGSVAPGIEKNTLKGDAIDIANLRGKYVVLDFWGTWCGYCMYEMPELKKYYEQYNDKLEIVGIACNDKETAWRAAVKKNEMNWIQVLNDNQNEDLTLIYAVQSFPTKFIIDKEGKIMYKFKGAKKDFYKTLDSLLVN